MFIEAEFAFNEGGNDGFWRFQLRSKKTGRWVKMNGLVYFEYRIPGDKNVYRAYGTFQGNIRRGASIIRVGEGESLPPGDYEIASEFVEPVKAMLKAGTPTSKTDVVDAPKKIDEAIGEEAAGKQVVASVVGDLEVGDIVQQDKAPGLYGRIASVDHSGETTKLNVEWSDGSAFDMDLPKDQKIRVWNRDDIIPPSKEELKKRADEAKARVDAVKQEIETESPASDADQITGTVEDLMSLPQDERTRNLDNKTVKEIVDLYENTDYGDLQVSNVSIVKSPGIENHVYVSGQITTKEGEAVGTFFRTITKNEDGSFSIEHKILKIDDKKYRGTGFGKKFSKLSEAMYKKLGISRIEVQAGDQDGAATWAKAGYSWAKPPLDVIKHLRRFVAEDSWATPEGDENVPGSSDYKKKHAAGVDALKKILDRLENSEFGSEDYPTPLEIVSVPEVGKYILGDDTEWSGVKRLDGKVEEVKAVLPETTSETVDAPKSDLKPEMDGEDALSIIRDAAAGVAAEDGRFPVARSAEDVEAGTKKQYAGVFEALKAENPDLVEQFKDYDEFWAYAKKSLAAGVSTRYADSVDEIPELMKAANRIYARDVLGLDPDGEITFYRNAINNHEDVATAAAGYASLDRNMAFNYNSNKENNGANGRYSVKAKPDEILGLLGYSDAVDEHGVVIGPDVTSIPGRVERLGDLGWTPVNELMDPELTNTGPGGGSKFRFFSTASTFEFPVLDANPFAAGENDKWSDFYAANGLEQGAIPGKYDELYGEGAFERDFPNSSGVPRYDIARDLFTEKDGQFALDPIKFDETFKGSNTDLQGRAGDDRDKALKFFEAVQQLSGQRFMNLRGEEKSEPVMVDETKRKTGLFNEYSPERLDQTAESTPLTDLGFEPWEEIVVYRGIPGDAEDAINPGDWVTANEQLAKDYAGGGGKVVKMLVKARDLLADESAGEGGYTEEMIYRPAEKEVESGGGFVLSPDSDEQSGEAPVTHTFDGKTYTFSPEEIENAYHYISRGAGGSLDVTDEEGREFNERMRALTDYLRPGKVSDETIAGQEELLGYEPGTKIKVGELRHSAPPARFDEITENGIRPKITDKVGMERYSQRRFGVFMANDYTSAEAGELADVFRIKVPETELRVDSGYTPYGQNLYIERTIDPSEIEYLGHIPAGVSDESNDFALHDGRGAECTICNPELKEKSPAEPETVDAPNVVEEVSAVEPKRLTTLDGGVDAFWKDENGTEYLAPKLKADVSDALAEKMRELGVSDEKLDEFNRLLVSKDSSSGPAPYELDWADGLNVGQVMVYNGVDREFTPLVAVVRSYATWFGPLSSSEESEFIKRFSSSGDFDLTTSDAKNMIEYINNSGFRINNLKMYNDLSSEEKSKLAISTMVSDWAGSSNDAHPRSLAVQNLAEEIFGIENASKWDSKVPPKTLAQIAEYTEKFGDMYRAYLRAQYELTQQKFKDAGITEVVLYRGMTEVEGYQLQEFDEFSVKNAEIQSRPLSSWSTSIDTAEDFARTTNLEAFNDKFSVMLRKVTPVDRIFATPFTGIGCYAEQEIVVFGGVDRADGVIGGSDGVQGMRNMLNAFDKNVPVSPSSLTKEADIKEFWKTEKKNYELKEEIAANLRKEMLDNGVTEEQLAELFDYLSKERADRNTENLELGEWEGRIEASSIGTFFNGAAGPISLPYALFQAGLVDITKFSGAGDKTLTLEEARTLIDTINADNATDEYYSKISLYTDSVEVQPDSVRLLVGAWATTSNDDNPLSLAIQDAAKRALELDTAIEWNKPHSAETVTKREEITDKFGKILEAFVEAQYAATQGYFQNLGIKEVEVYRGMYGVSGDEMPSVNGGDVQITSRPLSSWSTSKEMAEEFAESKTGIPVLYSQIVPVDRIFSTPFTGVGCLSEEEIVLLGKIYNVYGERL